MPIVNPVPKELDHPLVKGVFANGCVERGDGSRFRRKAHSHIKGKFEGWICFLSAKRLSEKMLILHELAHIISKQGHTDKFRKILLEIGGTIDPVPGLMGSCHKKIRGVK